MTLVLAHRGARRRAPENTLDGFRLAIELGADGVELDVHATRDHELVVRHDADSPFGLLGALTRAEVVEHLPTVPTLASSLETCAGHLVNVEIKNLPHEPGFDADETAAALVVDLLAARRAAGRGSDLVLVSSFHLPTIDRVHELDPDIETAVLLYGGSVPSAIDLAVEHGHGAIHPAAAMLVDDADALVASAHDAGLRVNVWTVNEPDEIRRLAAAGVDAVITDVPDVAIATLHESGRQEPGFRAR